jgi:RecA-family ATPase
MRSSQPITARTAASQAIDPVIILEERAEVIAVLAANGIISTNEDALDGVSHFAEENELLDAIGTEQVQSGGADDYAALLRKTWEMQDSRDRWRHTGEPPPATTLEEYGPNTARVTLDPIEPLTLVSPQAWKGAPLEPMRWLATNRIPAGDATILSGDGGGGKTTVALQLAVAVERGLGDWLGTTCESGPVIFFSGEEPEQEMRRRLARVTRKLGIDPAEIERLHFHFADPDRCLLGVARPNGPIAATPLFESLAAAVLDIRPAVVMVDSIAAVFGGNQNDRTHARSFVGLFRKLARQADCAVLLLDHPSLSGITSGTGRGGSMDWQNATRARLHLETVKDAERGAGRVLEVKKTNYGPCGEKVKLRWEDGCFVLESAASSPVQAAAANAADRAYLDCLDVATEQGRNVFASTGRGYAPNVFAEMPQANGITARALKAAQERLFSTGTIHNEPCGPASRNSRRIARKRQS